MIWLYNLLWILVFCLGAPLWIPWVLASPTRRKAFWERFSPLPPLEPGTIWIHASSVGEAEAARPLVAELERLGTPLLITTFTSTGRDQLRRHFPGLRVRLVPLDLPGLVNLSLRRARPKSLVLVETEIWPNVIRATHGVGGRVVIISGRISDRSFPRYRRMRHFLAYVLQHVDRIGVRSEEDGRRFVALGAAPESVSLTGDLKLDRPSAPPPDEDIRHALGPGPFLIGGSTHAGEEEALLDAWAALRRRPRRRSGCRRSTR